MKNVILGSMLFASTLVLAQTTRNMGDFSSVKVYDRINAELIPSSENKVEIISNNDSSVETVNKNGELKIKMTTAKILQGETTRVKVYYKNLNDVQASQGAVISGERLESSLLNLTANEGSKINLEVDADKLNVKGNSGGEIKVTGKADSQDVVMNSGAQFYGRSVDSKNVSVTVNAGGNAEVFASDSAEMTTRAGGKIDVYGNPDNRKEKKVAGGTINFK